MAELLNPALSDPMFNPDDAKIFSLIGDRKSLWTSVLDHLYTNYAGCAGEWNYYNDGKKWLYKMVYKKKTLYWIGITEDTFRITFWFSDRAIPIIEASDLPEKIKDDFRISKKYGAIRAVSIIIRENDDVNNVIKLVSIKARLK